MRNNHFSYGVATRSADGKNVNGDSYLIKEWEETALVALIDGLGHGEEAAVASTAAKNYVDTNSNLDIADIMTGLHRCLSKTRGAVVGLARIDKAEKRFAFCGVGNIEVRVISDPPMHPTSLEGIVGMGEIRLRKFQYNYNQLRALVLHSDGVSTKFELSDSISHEPQKLAEFILEKYWNKFDDATVIATIESPHSLSTEQEIQEDIDALLASEKAQAIAKEIGFHEADQTKIAIATLELGRNITKHAKGAGEISITRLYTPRPGIQIAAVDQGPGIANIEDALEKTQSTKNGLGFGLGAVKRLMDEFTIESKLGEGTTVIAVKWTNKPECPNLLSM